MKFEINQHILLDIIQPPWTNALQNDHPGLWKQIIAKLDGVDMVLYYSYTDTDVQPIKENLDRYVEYSGLRDTIRFLTGIALKHYQSLVNKAAA